MQELKAYYGLRKLTKKAIRRPSIIVVFENGKSSKNIIRINQMMKILHVRNQTKQELTDAKVCNRMFTVYEMFLHDKKYKNDPEKAIEHNYMADKNHVSEQERLKIKEAIQSEIYSFYDINAKPKKQLQLF